MVTNWTYRWIIILVVIGATLMAILSTEKKVANVQDFGKTLAHAKPARLQPVPHHDRTEPDFRVITPNIAHEYDDEVDLRIIVMTYNRARSLQTLLETLNELVVGSDIAALEIFVDRNKNGEIHNETLQTAINFKWKIGKRKEVFVWEKHTGIGGQWRDTWRPKEGTKEIALILEDDISVSPWAYKWLKAVHAHYGDRDDIFGYTLQSHNIPTAIGKKPIKVSNNEVSFMYRLLGTWGFAPQPTHWNLFQNWYRNVSKVKAFHPYVPGTLMTSWYQGFERRGTESSMWDMWYIYYTNERHLYCVYNNIGGFTGKSESYLSENRKEPGLHFGGKGGTKAEKLLKHWDEAFVHFSNNTTKLNFDGTVG